MIMKLSWCAGSGREALSRVGSVREALLEGLECSGGPPKSREALSDGREALPESL